MSSLVFNRAFYEASSGTVFPLGTPFSILAGDEVHMWARWFNSGSTVPTVAFSHDGADAFVNQRTEERVITSNKLCAAAARFLATEDVAADEFVATLSESTAFVEVVVAVHRPGAGKALVYEETFSGNAASDPILLSALAISAAGVISACSMAQNTTTVSSAATGFTYPATTGQSTTALSYRTAVAAIAAHDNAEGLSATGAGLRIAFAVLEEDAGPSNSAPVAVDDTATTSVNVPVTVDVLANDTDADVSDTLSVTQVNATAISQGNPVAVTNGSVDMDSSGRLVVTPATDYDGDITFSYTVSDGTATDTGSVTITVTVSNEAPVAVDDTATTPEGTPVNIDVLANDTDSNDNTLTVTHVDAQELVVDTPVAVSNGTVTKLSSGLLRFSPAATYDGVTTFDYTVSDGALTDTATVTVTVTNVIAAPVVSDVVGAPSLNSIVVTASISSEVAPTATAALGGQAVVGPTAAVVSGSAPNFTATFTFENLAPGSYTPSVGASNSAGATSPVGGPAAVVSYVPPTPRTSMTVTLRATSSDPGVAAVTQQFTIQVTEAP